jgi:hypothetical protein
MRESGRTLSLEWMLSKWSTSKGMGGSLFSSRGEPPEPDETAMLVVRGRRAAGGAEGQIKAKDLAG